ncbi:pyrokinin-1 receptor-like [Chelonus insularis]|uniref:pyrokinin-1 receptor-like n=1 Tax=Chelonus insularis TaxID=460826 RepID=UPI00158C4FBA|nr:pyrokinin-1 receptor-like [Chelonus insularis]
METAFTTESMFKANCNLSNTSSILSNSISTTDAAYRVAGSRRDALYVVLPVTIIYLSIFLTGTIGNISTCIVIARNKSMHTATNYYLFSLAVSDLLLLFSGLPAEVYLVWSKYPYIFGEGFCILRGLAAECSTNASVLTITAFTIERYVAICHPFLSQTMSKLSRAIKLILFIWLISLCFAIPQALQFGIIAHPHISPDLVVCTLKTFVIKHSFELSTFLFFVIPMTLITVLYSMIGLKLRKSNAMKKRNIENQGIRKLPNSKNRRCESRHSTGKSSRRVLKMLVAVVVAFFICWAPFHVQRLIAIYGTGSDHVTSKSKWMEFLYLLFTYISGVLYYISTTINPILYNIMSNKFRAAFKETLARSCGNSKSSSQREPRSYSSLSRSRQRALGNFGCKTIGTGGTISNQESSEGSASLKDRHLTPVTEHPSIQKIGQFNENSDFFVNNKAKSNEQEQKLLETNKNAQTEVFQDVSHTQEYLLDDQHQLQKIQKNENDNKSVSINGDIIKNKETIGNMNNKSKNFGLPSVNEKKWWRMFKWLPGTTMLKLTKRPRNYVDVVISDIESNREEYSMTTCYIAGEHRSV